MNPVPEAMADHDEVAALSFGCAGVIAGKREIILRHRFQPAQEIAARRGDLPAFIVADHITGAENVDGPYPRRKPLETRAPFRAARGEHGQIPVERSQRSLAAGVTCQNFQYRYLYTHSNASDRNGFCFSARSEEAKLRAASCGRPVHRQSYPQA
jgi:hypothetical protein